MADISPRGREPGLRAFVCSECGAVESVLGRVLIKSASRVRLRGKPDIEPDIAE